MDLCTPFTKKEEEALRTVVELARLMISDDGKVEPGNEEAEAAIRTVEAMLPDPT